MNEIGKWLLQIHRYNAWVVISLAITGIMLYVPFLRGSLALIRIPLKHIHITIGVISILIIVSYIPFLGRHWQSLKKVKNRQMTILASLTLLCGWVISGIGLWLEQLLPPSWTFLAVKPNGKYIKFYSGDKTNTDTLTIQQASPDDVMIAVLMDGKPIPQQLGGPVRLIVPKMFAYKSVKWLEMIEVIEKPHIGYWKSPDTLQMLGFRSSFKFPASLNELYKIFNLR